MKCACVNVSVHDVVHEIVRWVWEWARVAAGWGGSTFLDTKLKLERSSSKGNVRRPASLHGALFQGHEVHSSRVCSSEVRFSRTRGALFQGVLFRGALF
jgi:hypothetical protein